MEKKVELIVFRRITTDEFYTINQPGSAYGGSGGRSAGGGQSYIDIPTGHVPLDEWYKIIGTPTGTRTNNRPEWTLDINSMGLDIERQITIAQRRNASVMITSQKKDGKSANRVPAWHPDYSNFPTYPLSEGQRNPLVYIVKTADEEFWAGWTNKTSADAKWYSNEELDQLFTSEEAGLITCDGTIFIETNNSEWPFFLKTNAQKHHTYSEKSLTEMEFEEDVLEDVESLEIEERERLVKVKTRNSKIVRNLKKLYNGKCQITGDKLTFRKKDGEYYSEAHHLIALGDGGSDDYRNIIIISPLIHRMLHYANVSEIDLSEIENNELTIQINKTNYTITWHPEHARTVQESLGVEQDN